MTLRINGEMRDFDGPLLLADLVAKLGMKQDRVAIELNRNIAPREQWNAIQLADGDQLEIVQFVGGGHWELKAQEPLRRNSSSHL